jgi:hypothetical protein
MYDEEAYDICPIALKDVRVSILTDKANACFNKNVTTDYSMHIAIEACNKALEIIPSSTEVLKVRAEAYRKLGKKSWPQMTRQQLMRILQFVKILHLLLLLQGNPSILLKIKVPCDQEKLSLVVGFLLLIKSTISYFYTTNWNLD